MYMYAAHDMCVLFSSHARVIDVMCGSCDVMCGSCDMMCGSCDVMVGHVT